jgi:hypothetical protein
MPCCVLAEQLHSSRRCEVEKSEESIAPSPQSLELIQSRVVPSLEKLQEDDMENLYIKTPERKGRLVIL